MGMDIHMFVVKDGEILAEDIYEGRSSEWFGNLRKKTITNIAYRSLPTEIGWENCGVPGDLKKKYTEPDEEGYSSYFDFYKIKVEDFYNWYTGTKPSEKAGWVRTCDKWLYETKGIEPYEDEIYHYLPKDANMHDWHWLVYEDKYEQSTCIADYLIYNRIPGDAYIIFCFDN